MKRILLIILALTNISIISSQTNIENLKEKVITKLQKNNPEYIEQFNNFYRDYEKAIFNFLDVNNKHKLIYHIARMKQDFNILSEVYNNNQFIYIKTILKPIKEDLLNLIKILTQFINSKNHILLALKIKKYKYLLPNNILNKGDIYILNCLKHRLNC